MQKWIALRVIKNSTNTRKQKQNKTSQNFPTIVLPIQSVRISNQSHNRNNSQLFFRKRCIFHQIYFIWTIPALISFWILSITPGFLVCSCAALGFSWKSTNTCIQTQLLSAHLLTALTHYTPLFRQEKANLSHNRVLKNVLNLWIWHCLGLHENNF